MPNYATALEYPCPHCDEGVWVQDVDINGEPIGPPSGDCGCSPDGHTAQLRAAWDEYMDQDFSEAWNRRYAGADSSDAVHAMREARRLK